jgi:hypothetical protein
MSSKLYSSLALGAFFGMTNLEHEWRVGRQLALLTEPGAALPGFMGTGAGVITMSGHFTGIENPLAMRLPHWLLFAHTPARSCH